MANPTDTTDKMFPPPENPNPDAPIPIGPSLRVEFLTHRLHMDRELTLVRKEVTAALARLAPEVTGSSIRAKVKGGALAGLRYGAAALALGEAGAELANALGRPEVEGPLRLLVSLLGG